MTLPLSDVLNAEFKLPPYEHQMKEFELYTDAQNRALIWQMRTGKTKQIIDAACHLYKRGEIDTVVIFAPNGVHEQWLGRQLDEHLWDSVREDVVTWCWITSEAQDKTERRFFTRDYVKPAKFLWASFSSATLQNDIAKQYLAKLTKRNAIMGVFDESHEYRTPGSKRSMRARGFAKKCDYRRILTGTPVHNSPLNAWAQFELMVPGCLGHTDYQSFKDYYAEFETKYAKGGREYEGIKEYRNLGELQERMAPYTSTVLRSDCLDLSKLISFKHSVAPSTEQSKLFEKLRKEDALKIGDRILTPTEMKAYMIKYQQLCSGFVNDGDGKPVRLKGPNPKLDALLKEIEQTSGRFIVWCQFQEDIRLVASTLRKKNYDIVEYHGKTSGADKAHVRKVMAADTSDYEGPSLVGQPQSAGQGLDLSAASKVVWFSHTYDAIVREQADERATDMSGGNVEIVDLILGVDSYIVNKKLRDKKVIYTNMLEGLKEAWNDGV